jgi:single-strand DNA-binding protein
MAEQSRSASGYYMLVLVGNLGNDPELRYTPSGVAVCNFRIASSLSIPVGNGEREVQTIWHRVSTWGKQAEICNQYLKKGAKVLIEGHRPGFDPVSGSPRTYTRQDGTTGVSFEITADVVRFLGGSRGADGESVHADPEQEVIPF